MARNNENCKKEYRTPCVRTLGFAEQDVITSSYMNDHDILQGEDKDWEFFTEGGAGA